MSKYQKLWTYVAAQPEGELLLTFNQIEQIAGIAIDHSFLNAKKELLPLGREVKKISLKNKTVLFGKTGD